MAKVKATLSLTASRDQEARFIFQYVEIKPAGNKVVHFVDVNYNIRTVDISKLPEPNSVLSQKVGKMSSFNLFYNPENSDKNGSDDYKIKLVCQWLLDHPDTVVEGYEKQITGVGTTNVKFNYNYMEVQHSSYVKIFNQQCEAIDLYRTMNKYDDKISVLLYFGVNPIGMTHSEMHFMLSNFQSGIIWQGINTGLFISNFKGNVQPNAVTKININKAINLGVIKYKQGVGYTYDNEFIGSGIEEITATYARNAEKQIAIETKTNAIGMNIYDDIPMEEMPKAKTKATTKIKEEVEV